MHLLIKALLALFLGGILNLSGNRLATLRLTQPNGYEVLLNACGHVEGSANGLSAFSRIRSTAIHGNSSTTRLTGCIGGASDDLAQVGLGIKAIQFSGTDLGVDCGPAFAADVGTEVQEVFLADRDGT